MNCISLIRRNVFFFFSFWEGDWAVLWVWVWSNIPNQFGFIQCIHEKKKKRKGKKTPDAKGCNYHGNQDHQVFVYCREEVDCKTFTRRWERLDFHLFFLSHSHSDSHFSFKYSRLEQQLYYVLLLLRLEVFSALSNLPISMLSLSLPLSV